MIFNIEDKNRKINKDVNVCLFVHTHIYSLTLPTPEKMGAEVH